MPKLTAGRQIGLWLVSAPLAALFLAAGLPTLLGAEAWVQRFETWGYPGSFRLVVGAVEVLSAVCLLIPRWAFLGACGIVMVMAGAAYTHLARAPDDPSRLAFIIILLGLAAFVAYSRRPWSD